MFALPIEERWTKLRPRGLTADWEVRPGSAWAYAVPAGATLERVERPVGDTPFSRRDPAVLLRTRARPVPGWSTSDGAADPVPAAPVAKGAEETIMLMPYATAKLRITAFPTLSA